MNRKINTTQLAALRGAMGRADGRIVCDRCTGKALRDRGFAIEKMMPLDNRPGHKEMFFITSEGRERATKKADTIASPTSGAEPDPSLLLDLNPEP